MSPTAATTRFARSRRNALVLALVCACGGAEPDRELAEATVALTSAPADALCLRIVVAGETRTATRNFDVGVAAGTVFSLTALPAGEVVFLADAFDSSCGLLTATSAHSWYGVPVRATLAPGTPASVTIEMHR
jgi:hypothetical protein